MIEPAEFVFVADLVRRRSGIVLGRGKEYLVDSRLGALARREGFASDRELVDALRAAPDGPLVVKVVEAMTTNETSFFRDPRTFEVLRNRVLPQLLARRTAERELSIWCAASSSGQEPYSIAIVLREATADLAGWRVRIVATDISEEMVRRCRDGIYSVGEIGRGLDGPRILEHFVPSGDGFRVRPELREMVEFRELNLAAPWPELPPMDVVFLRNVLIYFDAVGKHAVLDRVRGVLRPDGALFLGSVETTAHLHDGFVRVAVDGAAFYRTKGSPA